MTKHDFALFISSERKLPSKITTTKNPRSHINLKATRILFDLKIKLYFILLYAGILTPSDEFQYWADLSESAEKNSVRERATHFTELFKPIQKVCKQTVMYQGWPHERQYIHYNTVITFTTYCFYVSTWWLLTKLQLFRCKL